jgi:hypothetical protein
MPRGVPTAAELARAVQEFLADEVMPATEGRLRFMARVAANVAAQIERELLLWPELAQSRAARLAQLGVRDEVELCAAIRAGSLDDRIDEVRSVVRAEVVGKLRVANPRHLLPEDRE